MISTRLLSLATAAILLAATSARAEPLPARADWIPSEALLAIDLDRPAALLEPLLASALEQRITSMELYKRARQQPGFEKFVAGVRFMETSLGADWRTVTRKLLGGGATLAVGPKGGVLLIVDATEREILERLQKTVVDIASAQALEHGSPDRVKSREYRGVTGWSIGPEEAHAIVGRRLLLANRGEVLKAALDLRAAAGGTPLSRSDSWRAAREAIGKKAAAKAWLDLARLKAHPPVARVLTSHENPLAGLLFAGVQASLAASDWVAAGLFAQPGGVRLQVLCDGHPEPGEGPAAFALPLTADEGAMLNLAVPRRLAAFSLWRDLQGFYAAKDELFPERTSGLIFFENMMGIFFNGRDFTEEVLSETLPETRIVLARQEFDPKIGTPAVQYPAFALVLKLRHPDSFSAVAEEAWQKALGLINFTRGQQALPGLIIDRDQHRGRKYTLAHFTTVGEGDRSALDARFNFRPAIAVFSGHLILSSTDGLARDIIDELAKEALAKTKPYSRVHTVLELDPSEIAKILAADRDALVRQNMLEKGHSRQAAEGETAMLISALEWFDHVEARLGSGGKGPARLLDLEVSVR